MWFTMQHTRRRAVLTSAPTLNLLARSFSKSLSPAASDRLSTPAYGSVEVGKSCEDCSPSICSQRFANWILEPLQRHVAGLWRIENANPHHGCSEGTTFTLNPNGTQTVDRGRNSIFCFSVKEDQFPSYARPVSNKLVSCGVLSDSLLGKYLRKADVRVAFKPLVIGFRGPARSLHTEMKVEKHVVEKSEEVATVRKLRSAVKTKISTSKRRRIGAAVVPTTSPRKTTVDLEVPNSVSVVEDFVPASSTEAEVAFASQMDIEEGIGTEEQVGTEEEIETEEEIGTAWQEAFREMDDDDLEETQEDGDRPVGQIVQTPSESVDHFQYVTVVRNEEMNSRASAQAMALLRAALDEEDEEEGQVEVEFQRSLKIGIVGAPNAGKSLLTNQLVGSRVSAVSRKTNTTHREHLGVFTKGDTQLLYYDTPGLHLDIEGSPLRVDAQHRVRNAWEIVDFCEALVVLVDAERQIRRPDMRVQRLVEKLGKEQMVSQKRVLCLNKVDIIKNKRTLLPLAKQFEDLYGFDRIFMISGLSGSGVKDVTDYLVSQAVLRPWDEDPENKDHRDIALEVVREQVFEHLHEELPHATRQRLVSWKYLKDGSIRIHQLLLVAQKNHQKILVGKDGAVIGDIGIKARKELTEILGTTVHLVLDVKLMTGTVIGDQ